ncbi:MAG: ABC transporter ATP-binding protein [Clostridia bacterium]|nr:ABC transporter ATP-binding protein [Clostridia bacterium]
MIECKNLSVKGGNTTILSNISLKAKQGEIAVILGKNGSGKTTLLRAISSSIPYKGEIFIGGRNIKEYSKKMLSQLVALMPQSPPVVPLTVKELVSLGRYPYTGISGILSENDKNEIAKAIKSTKIEDIEHKRADIISGGERKKAYFAMMLARDPQILLLDEPSSNLDIPYQRYFTNMLKSCQNSGKTTICVLHDINHAIEIAQRIILLEDSRIVFNGTVDEFISNKIPENCFELERIEYTDSQNNKKFVYK